MIVNPEKFDIEMIEPSGITGNEWCLVLIVVATQVLLCNICPFRLLLQFIRETSYARVLKQMQLATDYSCTIKRSASQCGPFLKTDNARCCITKYVMSKCPCLFERMRDFRTSTRTKVFRFNQKFIKVFKCSAKFKCRPVGKIRWYWVWCINPAAY